MIAIPFVSFYTLGMNAIPKRTEADSYYFRYIDRVTTPDIVGVLHAQLAFFWPLLQGLSEEKSLFRYALGKWSIREVLNHIIDTERVFLYRALWFARGFESSLPSFEQETAVSNAKANSCSWVSLLEEFRITRLATHQFFKNLPPVAWDKSGTASDKPFTVRAIAFIVAGHLEHHMAILRERYLSDNG
jgi:hypothetical protein